MSISFSDMEVKLVTRSKGHERLCSVRVTPFPFVNKWKRVDKVGKKYVQVIPAVWKAEKRLPEVIGVNQVSEVLVRKLWTGEEILIPAGSVKLGKVRTKGNWKGEGYVESIPLEKQDADRELILPKNAYNLLGRHR